MKPWIGCEIKLIRSQLGWSRVQLAEHLGCSPLKLIKLEADEVIPTIKEKTKLEALSYTVNEQLDRHDRREKADSLMESLGVDQIHIDDTEALS